ncbi:chromosomal replication initiator protein DnaA [Candidatus Parcubacteria bacterium]|nr:MAG: chromosomal replication initiator protein DnaA [Candidatus Parcubacteria bacterium]
MEEIWKSVLAEIELEVSKAIFLTFLKSTQLLSLDGSTATISAPTFITAEYIEKRYHPLIKKVLDKKTGKNMSLVFVSQNKTPSQKKESSGPLFTKDVLTEAKNNSKPQRVRLDYTFETLAVSESNQLGYTAANTVASSPGTKYNPLLLYGTVGVGKTHLMHAVANKLLEEKHNATIIYLTTEEFTNEVVEAIRDKTTAQMRKKFRNADILLLDDIQFLSGKERVQEELFHTFNTLVDKQKQIILSSDRPPSEIKKIEARLASRFEGGLSVDIEPPDFELRTAILLIKSKKYGMELSLEEAKTIAEKVLDARALEGFLLKLTAQDPGKEISINFISKLLGKKDKSSIIRPDDVINSVCSFFNIKPTQLKGSKRNSFLVKPRHICMYLLKEDVGLTHVEIGNLLGGRDHTTVMYGVEKVAHQASTGEKIKEEIMFIKRKISDDFQQ